VEEYDSFLTHKKMLPNLNYIKNYGVEEHLHQLKERMELLEEMLREFNEGRSKSFYCMAATLLSVENIRKSIESAKKKVDTLGINREDLKNRAKILKEIINDFALKEHVNLKLRKPSTRAKS